LELTSKVTVFPAHLDSTVQIVHLSLKLLSVKQDSIVLEVLQQMMELVLEQEHAQIVTIVQVELTNQLNAFQEDIVQEQV
jgi:hypothetical protein